MTMRDPATGTPINPEDIDETGLGTKYNVQRVDGTDRTGGKHDGCRLLVLDLTHDSDARAVARIYATRVGTRRPVLARDLLQVPGVDDLRPGERYVDPEEVDLDEVRRRG
jgi:hypothetical protein